MKMLWTDFKIILCFYDLPFFSSNKHVFAGVKLVVLSETITFLVFDSNYKKKLKVLAESHIEQYSHALLYKDYVLRQQLS